MNNGGSQKEAAAAPAISLSVRFAFAAAVVLCNGMALLGGWVVTQIETGLLQDAAAFQSTYVQGILNPVVSQYAAGDLDRPALASAIEPILTASPLRDRMTAMNTRQFWDGRANGQFNGVDPFGARTFRTFDAASGLGNPNARAAGTLIAAKPALLSGIGLKLEQRLIESSSLASQAVGPPLSDFEMSCAKKTFADLGRKLIPLRALAKQKVHRDDSLFEDGRLYGCDWPRDDVSPPDRARLQS